MDWTWLGPPWRFRMVNPSMEEGFHTQGLEWLANPDWGELLSTSAISDPDSECHRAMWFGQLHPPTFRQVGLQ